MSASFIFTFIYSGYSVRLFHEFLLLFSHSFAHYYTSAYFVPFICDSDLSSPALLGNPRHVNEIAIAIIAFASLYYSLVYQSAIRIFSILNDLDSALTPD
jgi:hypothetical protein